MYFEDVDLAERLSRRGWLHVYAPSAVVMHEGGHATRREPHRMQRVHHTSALRYLAGQYPGRRHSPLRGALRAGLGARMLISYVSGRVAAGARFQRRAAELGTGRGAPTGRRTERAPRSDHGRRLRHPAVAAVPRRPPQAAPRRRRRPRTAPVRTACWPRRSAGCAPLLPADRIWVCTAARYGDQVRAALPELRADRLILEPVARDTANAVGLAAALVAEADADAELAVVSADHVIRPVERFAAVLTTAYDAVTARPDALVTLGITPTSPATGFGYVQRGAPTEVPGVAEVAAFREKPDRATAEEYLASGTYLWNSGMFVWRAQTVLDALARHLPETAAGLRRIVAAAPGADRDAVLAEVFPTLPKISVDYAVLEPAATEPGRVLVADLDVDWLDVGSWPALAHTLGSDGAGNALRGSTVVLDGSGNIVVSDDPDHVVALVGVRDSVVVHTADVTMVCPVGDAERVKQLLAAVEELHGARYS